MTSHVNSIESRLFSTYWDDGLLDLFFGLCAIAIGVLWSLDLVAAGPIVPVALIPFWSPLRRRLIEPRAGIVEFGDRRTRGNRRVLLDALWLGLALFGLLVFLYWSGDSGGEALISIVTLAVPVWVVIPAVPAWLVGLLAALIGTWLKLTRFWIYAVSYVVCGLAIIGTRHEPQVAVIGGGILTAIGGAVLLTRFLGVEVEVEDGSS